MASGPDVTAPVLPSVAHAFPSVALATRAPNGAETKITMQLEDSGTPGAAPTTRLSLDITRASVTRISIAPHDQSLVLCGGDGSETKLSVAGVTTYDINFVDTDGCEADESKETCEAKDASCTAEESPSAAEEDLCDAKPDTHTEDTATHGLALDACDLLESLRSILATPKTRAPRAGPLGGANADALGAKGSYLSAKGAPSGGKTYEDYAKTNDDCTKTNGEWTETNDDDDCAIYFNEDAPLCNSQTFLSVPHPEAPRGRPEDVRSVLRSLLSMSRTASMSSARRPSSPERRPSPESRRASYLAVPSKTLYDDAPNKAAFESPPAPPIMLQAPTPLVGERLSLDDEGMQPPPMSHYQPPTSTASLSPYSHFAAPTGLGYAPSGLPPSQSVPSHMYAAPSTHGYAAPAGHGYAPSYSQGYTSSANHGYTAPSGHGYAAPSSAHVVPYMNWTPYSSTLGQPLTPLGMTPAFPVSPSFSLPPTSMSGYPQPPSSMSGFPQPPSAFPISPSFSLPPPSMPMAASPNAASWYPPAHSTIGSVAQSTRAPPAHYCHAPWLAPQSLASTPAHLASSPHLATPSHFTTSAQYAPASHHMPSPYFSPPSPPTSPIIPMPPQTPFAPPMSPDWADGHSEGGATYGSFSLYDGMATERNGSGMGTGHSERGGHGGADKKVAFARSSESDRWPFLVHGA
ncbi:hypothetical protein BD626DRAFT_562886 [Schizophyllum amplum]|uniref:Uncharacterized protein n=1 Tax=Schizophyllum amplum TaxID=97359 RepID=A0A550CWB5_9AGAR|nr:hypothetical protein BD626DRAFT_562886 [Auriculariopsis ampla]